MMHSDSQPAGLPQLCAQTRERFEAWESQELAGAERQQFEEHLSACRSCSRALAEFEYVSLRLRQSFVWQEPPADFTHRVMDEVRRHAALDDLQAPEPGFTGRLRDRLFGTADAAEDGQRDETAGRVESFADRAAERLANPADKPRHTLRLASLLLSAAALLVAALLIFGGDDAVQPEGGSSDAAWSYVEGERDDVLRLLTDGVSQHLAPQSALELPAQLSWQGTGMVLHGSLEQSSDGAGDAGSAELELSGEGALRFLAARELRLQGGALQLRAELGQDSNPRSTAPVSTAPMSVSLPSGLRVELSRAELALLVQRVHAHEQDEFLLEGPLYRVSVHVLAGEALVYAPERAEPLRLVAGKLLSAEPLQPLRVFERDPLRSSAITSAGTSPASQGQDFVVRGIVRGADQRPLADAQLELRIGGQGVRVRSDERGAYELRLALDTPLNAPGMVIASAPDGQQLRSSRALLGQVQGPEVQRRDFLLTAPGELVGRLVDAERAPLGGAEMQFVRIDTLLDRAERVASVRTESDGSFLASSLPELELGERLAVLIEAAGHPVFARYELEPEASTGRVELQAPELRQVTLRALGERSRLLWIERRPNGPLAAHVLRLERHELPAGRRELRVSTMRGMELAHWEDDGRGMPSRLHVQRVNFETGELWPYVRERLTVVGRENGALLAQRFRLVRRSDGAILDEGRVLPNGSIELSLPFSRGELSLSLLGNGGWESFALHEGGVSARYRLGSSVQPLAMQDPRVLAQRMGELPSGSGRYGDAPEIFGENGGAGETGETGEGSQRDLRRLELRLSEAGMRIAGAKLFAQIGDGPSFLAGWSDYEGRIVLPALPESGPLTLLAIDNSAGVLRAGREYLELQQIEPGVYALDLAPVREAVTCEFGPEILSTLELPARVTATLLDGSFRGMRFEAMVDASGTVSFPLVPHGRVRFDVGGSHERELGARGHTLRFE